MPEMHEKLVVDSKTNPYHGCIGIVSGVDTTTGLTELKLISGALAYMNLRVKIHKWELQRVES